MQSTRDTRRSGHHRLVEQRKRPSSGWFAKGADFETYVVELFPKEIFSILHDTRRDAESVRKPKSILDPDFRILHKPSGHKFWVECKFRSSARYGVVSWSGGDAQFERYLEFQDQIRPERVYVVIGLRGMPKEPKFMYCIPLDEIKEPDVFVNEIRGYLRHPHAIFTYSRGRLH